MPTHLTTSPEEAAAYLRRGDPVAFPTETVYGLGAGVFDAAGVQRVFRLKGRPVDNPLIVHIFERRQIDLVASEPGPAALTLIAAFFPGPLTLVLEKLPEIPSEVTGGLRTVAVRMPLPQLTRQFLGYCEQPVAAPSANLSGRPSPTTWQDVLDDFHGSIPCILQGPQSIHGLESTVVDCTMHPPVLLRPGSVSLESLREIVPDLLVEHDQSDIAARSPGMRHRHYAPEARVLVVSDPHDATASHDVAYIGLTPPDGASAFGLVCVCRDVSHYAFEIYHFLRTCDRLGVRTIYCQRVDERGIGRALMDRLARAAAR